MQTQDPVAVTGGIKLTPAGEAYALAHLRPSGCPAGIDPAAWRKAVERRVERHLGLVTTLLALLDGMDGDENIEDGDDPDLEPSIGGNVLNHEAIDCELDTADSEPSLGWTDMEARYGDRRMAPTFDPDREVDDADDEPNLGAPEVGFFPPTYGMRSDGQPWWKAAVPMIGQGAWARGYGDDTEQVDEDGGDVLDEPHDEEPDAENDGLEFGEADPAEYDSGQMIEGGNEQVAL